MKIKNDANETELVVGLVNIAAVLGEPTTSVLRDVDRARLPVVRLAHTMLAEKSKLLIAKEARAAAGLSNRNPRGKRPVATSEARGA